MAASHDTPGSPLVGGSGPRLVFRVGARAAAAEAAERIVAAWKAGWESRPPACVLVHDSLHAAVVEHLLRRMTTLEPGPGNADSLTAAMRSGMDGGATLVHGGLPVGEDAWQPTLFVNMPPGTRLLEDASQRGPVISVARVRSEPEAHNFLSAMEGGREEIHFCGPAGPEA